MYILGINYLYHDTSACLVKDGILISAVEEERFGDEKHVKRFPVNAINFCLQEAGITLRDIDYIGFSAIPNLGMGKKVLHTLKYLPRSLRLFAKEIFGYLERYRDLTGWWQKQGNLSCKRYFLEHHLTHAASAFLVSPFDKAAILSIDGMGEWDTALIGLGEGNKINRLSVISFPDSLGFVYEAITQYLGFRPSYDEGKTMGLSAYGKPEYLDKFREIIEFKNGRVKVDLSYFQYHIGASTICSPKFVRYFGKSRHKDEPIEPRYEDIACSLQLRLEEVVLEICQGLHRTTKTNKLCLAGGVALNSVMNGKILTQTPFNEIFIQPASGDAGTAIGAAFYIYNTILNNERKYIMENAYTGPQYSNKEIEETLKACKLKYEYYENIEEVTAKLLVQDKIIAWFQGRMEIGPRALGNRSILTSPVRPEMKDIVNQQVKFRESFRPFAPSILEENCCEYFDHSYPSPFMLLVYNVLPDKKDVIPAVIHVDGTGRIQTVNEKENPRYWKLIKEFEKLTGIPVILNTSFNVKGQPICCTPKDAIKCFFSTGLDYLVMGDYLISKRNGKNEKN